ncbi:MAG: riboflavin biosynthesis protein RibF [Clostridia bacterium]|nr:riboflavin biosynthesis protein RibF [Clostridia bacterium]
MEIYQLETMQKCEITENTIVALGTFDGCHRGHASVLMNAFYESKRKGLKSVAYTFSAIPRGQDIKSLMTTEEKIKEIKKYGIDYIAIEDFDSVKGLTPKEFYEQILRGKLKAQGASCGFNYRFGKNASGNGQMLEEFFENDGGSVVISEKVPLENQALSSTILRKMVEEGDVEGVKNYMPPYSIFSKVEEGKKLGRQLGFPTINQQIPKTKAVPKRGVYIAECYIGEDTYPCVTNVGVRPTVETGASVNVESHIIGFSGDLYGSYIRVVFHKYLRGERAFGSVEELKAEIEKNAKQAKEYFK